MATGQGVSFEPSNSGQATSIAELVDLQRCKMSGSTLAVSRRTASLLQLASTQQSDEHATRRVNCRFSCHGVRLSHISARGEAR